LPVEIELKIMLRAGVGVPRLLHSRRKKQEICFEADDAYLYLCKNK
jgi:hypothetical protein